MPKLNRFKQKQHFLYFVVAVLSFLFMCHFPGLMLSALFLSFMRRNMSFITKNSHRLFVLRFKYTVHHLLVLYRIFSMINVHHSTNNTLVKHFKLLPETWKKFGMVLETFYIFLVINVMQITVPCERETYNTNNFSWYSNSKLYCALRILFKLIFTGRVVFLCKLYLI